MMLMNNILPGVPGKFLFFLRLDRGLELRFGWSWGGGGGGGWWRWWWSWRWIGNMSPDIIVLIYGSNVFIALIS